MLPEQTHPGLAYPAQLVGDAWLVGQQLLLWG